MVEKDITDLPKLESQSSFVKKKRQLEPDMNGAKLAANAKCIAMIEHDGIYRNHNKPGVHQDFWNLVESLNEYA